MIKVDLLKNHPNCLQRLSEIWCEVLKMQCVAVREDLQNQGIASAMMAFYEEYALNNGFKEVYCYARSFSVPFYLKNKYEPEGVYFNEDTIPHLKMRKVLKEKENE